jgi:PhnB protein
MHVQPYLFFEGRAEEAIEFYQRALGAQVGMLMRYKDSPEQSKAPVPADKVMHAELKIDAATVMLSDGMASGRPGFQGFALSLDARDEAHAERLFAALSEGGKVLQPLIKTFFSPAFGMVSDRFGVSWMVSVFTRQ